jgi:FAD-dependent oxidoreductase domain-containing protein 1
VQEHFDVIIIGGGIIGTSIAYFLAAQQEFHGSILIVEKDPTYAHCSTTLSVGGIRQQFSTPENIEISKFSATFLKSIKHHLSVDDDEPDISFQEKGYLFLATEKGLPILNQNFQLQKSHGVDVILMNPSELQHRFPWLNISDLAAGSLGLKNEGWFDPYSLLMAFLRKTRSLGVHYRNDEVVGILHEKNRAIGVQLKNGETLFCHYIVNAGGPRAAEIAKMAGIHDLPMRSRKRFVYSFQCRTQFPNCPLVIDSSGVYFRPEGKISSVVFLPRKSMIPTAWILTWIIGYSTT